MIVKNILKTLIMIKLFREKIRRMSILEDKEYSVLYNGSEVHIGEEENYCEEIEITVVKKKLVTVYSEEPLSYDEAVEVVSELYESNEIDDADYDEVFEIV